jgi:hypothetical protein
VIRSRPGLAGAVLLAGTALAGCRDLADHRAEALVRTYNERLIDAYRVGDERIIEGLVGDEEAKKILGLIGVKTDMGITLDAALTEFRFAGTVRPAPGTLEVLTEERWHYRDRRIGTGETVGQESDDHYFMRYTLARSRGSWVVSKVAFERPPEVGRSAAPNQAPSRILHGMPGPVDRPSGAVPATGNGGGV